MLIAWSLGTTRVPSEGGRPHLLHLSPSPQVEESDLHPEGCSLGPLLPLPLTVSLLSAQCQRLPPARFLVPAGKPAVPRPTCSSHQEDGNTTRPPQSLAGQRRPPPRLLGGRGQGWTPWRRAPGTGRKGGAPSRGPGQHKVRIVGSGRRVVLLEREGHCTDSLIIKLM